MSVSPRVRDVVRQSWPKPTRDRKPKRRDTGPHPTVLILVKARANGRCERCSAVMPFDAETHHRIPRGMGGSRDLRINQASNLVQLCASCHRWIESFRDAARRGGWLVRRSADPWKVPIDSKLHGGEVLLADNGKWVPAPAKSGPTQGTAS